MEVLFCAISFESVLEKREQSTRIGSRKSSLRSIKLSLLAFHSAANVLFRPTVTQSCTVAGVRVSERIDGTRPSGPAESEKENTAQIHTETKIRSSSGGERARTRSRHFSQAHNSKPNRTTQEVNTCEIISSELIGGRTTVHGSNSAFACQSRAVQLRARSSVIGWWCVA